MKIKFALIGVFWYIEYIINHNHMDKKISLVLLVIGILLLLNGLGNIADDGRILTYDIASVLSGIGFIVVSRIK